MSLPNSVHNSSLSVRGLIALGGVSMYRLRWTPLMIQEEVVIHSEVEHFTGAATLGSLMFL